MRKNVANAILRIQQMPSVGRLHIISGNKTYQIIQTHPKSSLLYWHNEHEIHIVRFIIAKKQNIQ